MKYISALEYANQELEEKQKGYQERMDEFKLHLYSDKFVNNDNSIDRKDWIAVADVLRWIDYIKWGN
jgi:hypothetical protein